MLGLSSLGIAHTAISLVAVAAGFISFIRFKKIVPATGIGKLYILTTALTCITGFGIFAHGKFGPAHVLGVITLLVLAGAYLAGNTKIFGRASRYLETLAYTATFLFHMIPAVTETTTRLPVGKPWAAGPEDPLVKNLTLVCFIIFIVVVLLQFWALRKSRPAPASA